MKGSSRLSIVFSLLVLFLCAMPAQGQPAAAKVVKPDTTSKAKPPAKPIFLSCPDHVNASAPSGWAAVPPGLPFPFNVMMLAKFDGTLNNSTMNQTKYINCYYKGNSGVSGYDGTSLPTNSDNTPRIFKTLPGGSNAFWSCTIDPTGSNANQAKCVPNY